MAKQLAEHFRNILMAKTLPQPQEILELSREQIGRLKNQGEKPSEERLLSYISSLSQIENTIKYSSQPMIILEMELIKLCKNPGAENLKELIDRIETLEREITNLKSVKREAKKMCIRDRYLASRISFILFNNLFFRRCQNFRNFIFS